MNSHREAEKHLAYAKVWALTRWMLIDNLRQISKASVLNSYQDLQKEVTKNIEKNKDQDSLVEALGSKDEAAKLYLSSKISLYSFGIDAATIIFAHTIIDSLAWQLCSITALDSPGAWEQYIENKQVVYSDLKKMTVQEILKEKVDGYIQNLEKESLLKKLEVLHSVCRPPKNFQKGGYSYDPERIFRFDKIRHALVHGRGVSSLTVGAFSEGAILFYLQQTTFYLCDLVSNGFKLQIKEEFYHEAINHIFC